MDYGDATLTNKFGDNRGLTLPDFVRHVSFIGKNIQQIKGQFLSGCKNLISADLRGFQNAISIGDNFLSNCDNLRSVDFSRFSDIKQIGYYFLASCSGLTSVDLSNVSEPGKETIRSALAIEIQQGRWGGAIVG